MAVKTSYQIFDIMQAVGSVNFSIKAHDIDSASVTIIDSANAENYIKRKYPTRFYPVVKGASITPSESKLDLAEAFTLWKINRAHNIDRMYQALFDIDYSPIENYDRTESESTSKDSDTTYGKTTTNSGTDTRSNTGTDALAKTGTDTDRMTGTVGTDTTGTDTTTHTGTDTNETKKSGYNEPSQYVKDTLNTETLDTEDELTHDVSETTTHNTTDTITHNTTDTRTLNTTETTRHGLTQTDSGTDSLDEMITRSLRVHGNIGVTTNQQMIGSELKLRIMSLAEMLLDSFMDEYTVYY